MKQLITRTICNFKCHLTAETMLSILVQYGWDLQLLNLRELYLTRVQSTWRSLPSCVMTKQLETTNSKSMIHFRVVSSKETRRTEDARLWLMTCTSQTPTRSFLKLLQSLHTDQPSSKDLFGKTMLVFNLSSRLRSHLLRLSCNLKTANVHISSFCLYTSLKGLDKSQMEFWDFHLTKI